MIVDTLSPNGKPVEMRISECVSVNRVNKDAVESRNGAGVKKKNRPRKQIESKNERDIVFAVGMACLSSISEPGERHTCEEIAEFTGLSRQRIEQIENRALRKIRAALYGDKNLEGELKAFLEKR